MAALEPALPSNGSVRETRLGCTASLCCITAPGRLSSVAFLVLLTTHALLLQLGRLSWLHEEQRTPGAISSKHTHQLEWMSPGGQPGQRLEKAKDYQELRLRKVKEQDSKLSSERAAAGGRTVTVLPDLAAGEAPRGRELSGQRSGSGCSTTESWNTKS